MGRNATNTNAYDARNTNSWLKQVWSYTYGWKLSYKMGLEARSNTSELRVYVNSYAGIPPYDDSDWGNTRRTFSALVRTFCFKEV